MTPAPFGLPAELAELRVDYDLVGELGRGGAAVVYRARDRALGREVAIKVVHPRPTSPDDDPVARLSREARLVAQLQHPGVVAVYAVRRLRGGGLALIMQLVTGGTLKTAVQTGGPLAPERVEWLLRDVASALAYAHARGLVHRDVKPENIFLDDETGRALLADFGIARSTESDSMTMTGTAVGTPFYMSPEQVDGGGVDGRSDLYSLGLVAWEALTGRRPWDGESLYNVIYKQKFEELPPIEALRPDVPRRLQYVIERMLQKRPGARWAGAEGLLAQLDHPVLPADYTRWQRALPGRVERYRAAEAARVEARGTADAAEPLVQAATLHFARGNAVSATGPGVTATSASGSSPLREPGPTTGIVAGVGSTPTAPHLDESLPQPGVTVDLRATPAALVRTSGGSGAPLPYGDVVEPSWETSDTAAPRARRSRRTPMLSAAAAVGLFGLGGVLAYDRLLGIARARTVGPSAFVTAGVGTSDEPRPGTPPEGATISRAASIATQYNSQLASLESPPLLAAGGRHTCVLTRGEGTHCWGANDGGQLGDGGPVTRRTAPVPVAGVLSFTSITAGLAHSCALTRLGDVYCWGSNTRGQLGDATTVRRNAPVRVAGPADYTALAAGSAHTCAVTTDGGVRCWGAADQGQLGDGQRETRIVPAVVRIPGRVVRVAAGGQHTCATTDDGRLFCWGANADGQLGTGSRGPAALTPQIVPLSGRVVALGLGLAHSCAVTDDGAVWCWGRNDAGQLGTGTRVNHSSPVRADLGQGRVATTVTSGAAHTCAVDGSGILLCWGRNTRGALGDGTRGSRTRPEPVRLRFPVLATSAGAGHTCAVSAAGPTLCWGDNLDGQLGNAATVPSTVPELVRFTAGAVARTAPTVLSGR